MNLSYKDVNKFCIVSPKLITNVCEPVSLQEGQDIASLLHKFLKIHGGLGLAANQIGINKSVCVVNVKEKLYFINPKIELQYNPILFIESCLSFPGKNIKTKRYSKIGVQALNLLTPHWYGREDKDKIFDGEKFTFDYYLERNIDVLEAIVIQHEIAHLNGLTMYDFKYKIPNFHSDKYIKPQRNDKITIEKNNHTKEIKFKKLSEYEKNGWRILNGQNNI